MNTIQAKCWLNVLRLLTIIMHRQLTTTRPGPDATFEELQKDIAYSQNVETATKGSMDLTAEIRQMFGI